jgi:TonB family protein
MAPQPGNGNPPFDRSARPGSAVNTLLKIQSQFEEWEARDRARRRRVLLLICGALLTAGLLVAAVVVMTSFTGSEQPAPAAAKSVEPQPATAMPPAAAPTAIRYVTALTPEPRYARYADAWRRRIEAAAQAHAMPPAGLYGSLVLTTYLRPDGSVARIEVSRPSGHDALDQAAIAIVRAAAPFDAFPEDIRRDTALLAIVRTFSFEQP